VTDYCTLWPEGWWAHCCQAHDLAYAAQSGKAAADSALWQCVATSGEPASWVIGAVMFVGVTVFGRRFYRR
jgi:hypothetical protein